MLVTVALWVLVVANLDATETTNPTRKNAKPNIILINLDDADREMFRPEVLKKRFPCIHSIAKSGITFTNFHVTNPLCGPSRACLLRGQYAHAIAHRTNQVEGSNTRGFIGDYRSFVRKGYFDNDLGKWMKDSGYQTIFVGKYINFVDADHRLPAGWDDFYRSQGSRYFHTIRYTNRTDPKGSLERLPDGVYRTNAEADDVVRLIHQRAKNEKPLFIYFAPFGPHSQGSAAGGMIDSSLDVDRWKNVDQPKGRDFDEVDISDKPASYQKLDRLSDRIKRKIDRDYRERLLAVKSVDRAIKRIVDTLSRTGIRENTYVLITSDNGYSLGQHRICGKGNSLGRSSQVPLIVSGPSIKPGQTLNHLLAHIDLAPTILGLAGEKAKPFHDGKSFVPLLFQPESYKPNKWRESILIENWQSRTYLGQTIATTFCQLRRYDSIYTEWADGSREYYDLKKDLWELNNMADQLDRQVASQLHRELKKHRRPMPRPLATLDQVKKTNLESGAVRFEITGVSEDSCGIEAVDFIAYRLSTGEFWNGTRWQKAHCRVRTQLKNKGGIQCEWNTSVEINHNPDRSQSTDVMILPVAIAINGNISKWQRPARLSVDHRAPMTRIYKFKKSRNGIRFVGFASDDTQVAYVTFQLQNKTTGRFFDGSQWCGTRQTLRRQTNKEDRWVVSIPPISPGRYIVRARAHDIDGNFSLNWEVKEFDIQ